MYACMYYPYPYLGFGFYSVLRGAILSLPCVLQWHLNGSSNGPLAAAALVAVAAAGLWLRQPY